jgi:ribokinase
MASSSQKSGKLSTITVIGSLNVDYITRTSRLPQPGETFRAISFERGFGGKGANQAIACARLSTSERSHRVRVRMCGYIGTDSVGKEMRDYLAASEIDISLIQEAQNTTTGSASITVVEESGENCILIVAGANDCMTGWEEVSFEEYHLVVFQLESPIGAVMRHAIRQHVDGGAHVSCSISDAFCINLFQDHLESFSSS